MKNPEMVKVIYRKFKGDSSIIALFPEIAGDNKGNVLSYMHIGQHGAASLCLTDAHTVLATPKEYAELHKELESMGYVLKVCKRITRKDTETMFKSIALAF